MAAATVGVSHHPQQPMSGHLAGPGGNNPYHHHQGSQLQSGFPMHHGNPSGANPVLKPTSGSSSRLSPYANAGSGHVLYHPNSTTGGSVAGAGIPGYGVPSNNVMGMGPQRLYPAGPSPFLPGSGGVYPGATGFDGSPSKKLRGSKRWLSPSAIVQGSSEPTAISKVLSKIEDSRFLSRKFVRKNMRELGYWALLIAILLVGYKFFSDGSFSAVLTLSSVFQCFSLMVLLIKVRTQVSVAGVSMRSLVLFVVCLVFRLSSTLFFNGYLPVDKSGDWIYQLADVLSLLMIGLLVLSAHTTCAPSLKLQRDKDTCHVLIPVVLAGILALFVHPSLNQWRPADIAWTFALYVETFAMVPQLFMMSKIGGEVEVLTSHYVASMAVSKFFAFIFWFFSYAELAPRAGGRNVPGYAVLLAFGIQLLLFADFLYHYVNSLRIGKSMIITRI